MKNEDGADSAYGADSVNDVIDEYCIEKYGHRDWSYLRTGDRKLDYRVRECLKENNHTIEDGIVIWHALDKFIQNLKDGKYGLKH